MQKFIRQFQRVLIACVLVVFCALPAAAGDLQPLLSDLKTGSTSKKINIIKAIAASGHERAAKVLEAYLEGDLFKKKDSGEVFIALRKGSQYELIQPETGELTGRVAKNEISKIRVNNRLRGVIRAALGGLQLFHPDRNLRLKAAGAMFKARKADDRETLQKAVGKEQDADVKLVLQQALAAIDLSIGTKQQQLAAISVIEERGDTEALALLKREANRDIDAEVKKAAATAVTRVENALAMWDAGQTVIYGLSLGSVLLLAAIGLSITFGVMGVINMAHGEMIMIGAYTTYMVQELIRNAAPMLFDISLLIALPLAFLITGAIGVAIERGIIRFLYGRPLETLLATWGLSLVLQQAVRTLFGPTNQEVGNPSWMSGSFNLGQMAVTYNRLWIILFSLGVLLALTLVTKYTSFGLRMRAVTQNRRMAGNMGIRTGWVDALTFGLGSGIAGIAGVALSQIDNVSPNLGQSYIIDSFMVVVFGGVGNLWGTLVGAMSLGVLNKILEPMAGAVLGKILVLVLIILFIQKRPRGLFALRGRAIET